MTKSAAAQHKTAKSVPAKPEAAQKINGDTGTVLDGVAVEIDMLGHPVESKSKEDNKKEEKKFHYPEGAKLFSYKPKGGGEIIQFPMEFEYPDKVWLWRLNKQPFLVQTWAWMTRAGVPDAVQEQAVLLPDDEYPDLFNQWFAAMGGGAKPGE